MDFGTATEKAYPISVVLKMMEEFADHKCLQQLGEIERYLIVNTSLEVEKIVELKLKFKTDERF